MEFPTFDFGSMGETDVREEIIAPLLRHLGYRSGTSNNVIREQHLSYPRLSLGRKKSTDPYLRGKADYICEASGPVRWVIESKAPGELLDADVEEQAWSYANHPEIRAVYFVVTNGREFKVYQTNKGSTAAALFECAYEQMKMSLTKLENILSPAALRRDYPTPMVDTGDPIGTGLRSIVRVISGHIQYTKISMPIPPLQEMITTVIHGSVERREDGLLEAHLYNRVPFQSLQSLNEKLGLDQVWFTSTSNVLSIDPARPTVFENERQTILPKGLVSLNLMTWKQFEFPMNVTVRVRTRATGCLKGAVFAGDFHTSVTYVELDRKLTLDGAFEVQLA